MSISILITILFSIFILLTRVNLIEVYYIYKVLAFIKCQEEMLRRT